MLHFFHKTWCLPHFLVQTDKFHNQVPDISVNYVGHYTATHSHTATPPFFCTHTVCMHASLVMAWSNYTSYIYCIRSFCLFEGKLWAADGYLINKFPPDRSVFMLHASHSTSVLQSLMCFSQLSCFPLMWPKMTCGLSGKMVSAQDDELPFYFKRSVDFMANRSIKHQTSGHISLSLSYLKYVLFFTMVWNTLALADCAD